jgi:hypothetical protein
MKCKTQSWRRVANPRVSGWICSVRVLYGVRKCVGRHTKSWSTWGESGEEVDLDLTWRAGGGQVGVKCKTQSWRRVANPRVSGWICSVRVLYGVRKCVGGHTKSWSTWGESGEGLIWTSPGGQEGAK